MNFTEGPASKILQDVEVPIVTQSSCKSAYGTFGSTVIDDRIICAGYATGGKDACRVKTELLNFLSIDTFTLCNGDINFDFM